MYRSGVAGTDAKHAVGAQRSGPVAKRGDTKLLALSDSGVPIEDISRLVGHTNTVVTETVYRKQIRPAIMQGAQAMDEIFGDEPAT